MKRRALSLQKDTESKETGKDTLSEQTEIQQQNEAPSEQKSVGIPHSKKTSLSHAFFVAIATIVVSITVLWYYDILSSGAWPHSTSVTFLNSNENRSAFKQRMNDSSRPLAVIFYLESCIACIRMKSPFVKVANNMHSVVPFFAAELGDEANQEFVKEFDIHFVPSIFLVHGDSAQRLDLYKGGPTYSSLHKFLNDHVKST